MNAGGRVPGKALAPVPVGEAIMLAIPSERRLRVIVTAPVLLVAVAIITVGGLASPARAQNPDSVMRVVRTRYDNVTRGRARYVQVGRELDSLGFERWRTGRGWMVAAFEGDTLRTLVASFGAHRDTVESYYFWAGAPIVIRVSLARGASGGGGGGGKARRAEQRFYFDRGYLIRWADPAHTIRPVTTGAVFARAMHLLADATRLVDGARRERDHALVTPAPAEVAESMRQELRALMTSELVYFADNNRYAGDLTTVSYRPRAAVSLKLLDATNQAWAARATAAALPGKSCVAYLGHPRKEPHTAADHVRPVGEGEVACDRP